MNIKDYKFNVGDGVVTTDGVVGQITSICRCEYCERRGFYEITWSNDVNVEDISLYEAQEGFRGYWRIGKYRFHEFDRGRVRERIECCEKELHQIKKKREQLESQLANMDIIEKTDELWNAMMSRPDID